MKEERLEEVMEHFGGAVEKTVEGAANALDKSMNRAWSFGPVRLIGKALSFCAGAGLMESYFPLKEKGCHKAAKFCLISNPVIFVLLLKPQRGHKATQSSQPEHVTWD